jgi:hypothetical protein
MGENTHPFKTKTPGQQQQQQYCMICGKPAQIDVGFFYWPSSNRIYDDKEKIHLTKKLVFCPTCGASFEVNSQEYIGSKIIQSMRDSENHGTRTIAKKIIEFPGKHQQKISR